MSTLIDSTVGDGVTILHSHLTGARVDDGATVGPFAYLRPDAHLHPKAKAGTFVEIKNSEIGAGTKVPHLSYIGDADVGEGTNIGAGNITANYDGVNKHRTTIGVGRPDQRRHRVRRAGHGRRRRLHRRGHRRSPTTSRRGRSGSHERARPTSRATPSARTAVTATTSSTVGRTLRDPVSALDPRTGIAHLGTSLAVEYDKRLMVVAGPREPRPRGPHLREARRLPGRRHAPDLLQRRGLLPLRGVHPRGRPVHRPADLRQPRDRASRPTTR